ncbi:MAG TPA: IS3 family transposase [Hyphomicrobium zavarzinii]|nr:IS3 family transposase [Hyphomicrobium zavarzinii]
MRQRTKQAPQSAEETVRDIRRATRRHFSAEDKIRIVLEGLRGEDSIAELCRKEGIAQNLYYRWSKEFLEAGKKRLAGDTAREATSDEVKTLRVEARQLKEALAEVTLENRLLKKKRDRGWGGRRMRYLASEKLDIIRTVETSHLPVRRTLDKIGIPKTTFYAWLGRYAAGGFDALEDRKPQPKRVWNRIPDEIRDRIVARALEEPELSPREVAVAFTDAEKTFVSEASVYRILKAEGLVTSPAFIVMKAADAFANPTTAINQLWQTDFTYLKVTGWGWFYLSTVLDDFSRYIVAWKLCTTMSAADVTTTLDLALQASGLDQVDPGQRPRLLSDNGPSYVANDLSEWLEAQGMRHTRSKPYHPMTQGKIERWHLSLKSRILLENYYLPGDLERAVADFVDHYNHRRYHESLDNLTPADVYFGRAARILERRQEIKRRTIELRRRRHQNVAA